MKHDHDRVLELAATSLDWPLTPDEEAELEVAIRRCVSCRRAASMLAATNRALSPLSVEPSRHVDVAVRRSVRLGTRPFSGAGLLLAGVLATTALLGGVVAVAAPNVQTARNDPGVVPGPDVRPVPPETARPNLSEPGPSHSAAPDPEPSASPDPSLRSRQSNPLDVGGVAVSVGLTRIELRTEPGTGQGSAIEAGVHPGQRVAVAAGPQVVDGAEWYLVSLGTTRGWLRVPDAAGDAQLRPVRNGVLSVVDPSTSSVVSVDPGRGESWRVDRAGVGEVAWSRDGRLLALAVRGSEPDRGDIRLVSTTGEDLGLLAEDVADAPWLDWGAGLLAAVRRQGVGSIVVASPANRSLEYVAGAGSSPSWSPVAGRLAFLEGRASGRYALGLMRADGANRAILVSGGVPLQRPAWSPDGSQLAIFAPDAGYGCRICLVVARTGDVVPLTTDLGGTPIWSPDGRSVAFVASGGALHGRLLVAGLDGVSSEVRIPGSEIRQPEWSPDGRYLAFTAVVDGRRQLGTVRADGSDLQWHWAGSDDLGSVSWQSAPGGHDAEAEDGG